MFKLQIQWMSEGNWEPCVYPPTEYATAYYRFQEYSKSFPEHNYRIIGVAK